MRYTTIIDITEFPAVYNNPAARLLYLHLCLRSGYHDYDRDISTLSLRQMAKQTGLTLAAVRHAVGVLEKWQLIKRQGQLTRVRKFIVEQPISPRAKTQRQAKAAAAAELRKQEERKQAAERDERAAMIDTYRAQGKTPFMVYYEQQMTLAEKGDQNAADFCMREKKNYQTHLLSIQQQKQ